MSTDERGVGRPQGNSCDVGAFEAAADGSVVVSAPPNPVSAGAPLTIMATATNTGSEPFAAAKVTVPLPTGTKFVSAPQGCTVTIATATTVGCELGTLAPGQSRPIPVVVVAPSPGALIESASITGTSADFNPADDSATTTTVVQAAGGPGGGPRGAPTSLLTSRLLRVDRRGRAAVALSCAASSSEPCHDTLWLYPARGTLPRSLVSRNAPRLGEAKVVLAPGRRTVVRVRLARSATSALRPHTRLRSRLVLRSAGLATSSTRVYSVVLLRTGA